MNFSVVVPLYNEEKNIVFLIDEIDKSGLVDRGMNEVVLINNGSQDKSQDILAELARTRKWMSVVHLQTNLNYGGGIQRGIELAKNDVVSFIPGDLQVSIEDLSRIWSEYQKQAQLLPHSNFMVKGNRIQRMDKWSTKFVSYVYTFLSNLILNLKTSDVNALPKMFSRKLVSFVKGEKQMTFVWDSQLIYTARKNNWAIIEIPVSFHARREGVSSWSGKRIKVYILTLRKMFYIRSLR
jgi:glycosyltransferase involved in cell wall biosynthesis